MENTRKLTIGLGTIARGVFNLLAEALLLPAAIFWMESNLNDNRYPADEGRLIETEPDRLVHHPTYCRGNRSAWDGSAWCMAGLGLDTL
jgi:hypothetical protein